MERRPRSRCFQDVEVWRKTHAWVLAVYQFTEKWPRHEFYGLTGQLRRAASSVPMNFAEGFRRRTKSDKARYYNISQTSLDESEYCLILGRDLNYGDPTALLHSAEEIGRMLDGYITSMLGPSDKRTSWVY
jgi:four helix bundle protein